MPHVKLPAENQNLELYYEVHGSGDIKILFIMGLLTDGSAWYQETEFFAKQSSYQCVTFDNRGFGRSSSPLTIHYSTTQMAKDVLGLINHLQWTKCHIVAISMGGMIALELALIAPEKILSLTLLATHAGGLTGQAPFIGIRHMIRALTGRNKHSIVENALSMLYSAKTLADPDKRKLFYDYHMERLRKRQPISIPGIIGQIIAVHRHYVSYADLLKIRYSSIPCLIMVGTEDRLVRESNSYVIQRVLGCRLIKLDDSGHGLHIERADEINKEVLHLCESIRKNETSQREVPEDFGTELKALEQCCQHRTHCLVHDIFGFLKGLIIGLMLYNLCSIVNLTKLPFVGIHLTFESVILLACLNGLRRGVKCILNTFRARRFVREHRLELNRAAHHGGIGIALPEEPRKGIPYGCGFDYPIPSLIFIANLISLIYWTRTSEKQV